MGGKRIDSAAEEEDELARPIGTGHFISEAPPLGKPRDPAETNERPPFPTGHFSSIYSSAIFIFFGFFNPNGVFVAQFPLHFNFNTINLIELT